MHRSACNGSVDAEAWAHVGDWLGQDRRADHLKLMDDHAANVEFAGYTFGGVLERTDLFDRGEASRMAALASDFPLDIEPVEE